MDRKTKRYLNKCHKLFSYGKFVLDCRDHPCVVTGKDYDGFTCRSLITGKSNGCSFLHCGPLPLSKEEAKEMAEFSKTHTWLEYNEKYIFKQALSPEMRVKWLEHQKSWNFENNGNLV